MFKNLLPRRGLRRTLAMFGTSAALVCIMAVTASAYTLVLRNGQRMEIPDQFVLTKITLTFEISPGFNRTIMVSIINIPATERANRESPGSFFKHMEDVAPPVMNQPAPRIDNQPGTRAVRTLTNSDLAAIRQRRVESEQAYEARRKQLGLPSVAETRQRQDVEGALLSAQIREGDFAKAREESYWRQRARDLRNEIAGVDTQINYLRGRINEINQSSLANQTFTEIYPIWPNNRPGWGNGQWGVYPNWNPGFPGNRPARPGYGGWGYPNYRYPNYGYPNYGYPGLIYPNGQLDNYNRQQQQQQQSDLTYRLDDLLVRRAGLLARWRTLEDEARDARVPQVWLEP